MLVGAAYGTVGYTGETSSVTIVCCTELSRAHVKWKDANNITEKWMKICNFRITIVQVPVPKGRVQHADLVFTKSKLK